MASGEAAHSAKNRPPLLKLQRSEGASMNPITNTAIKLEKEAQTLYN